MLSAQAVRQAALQSQSSYHGKLPRQKLTSAIDFGLWHTQEIVDLFCGSRCKLPYKKLPLSIFPRKFPLKLHGRLYHFHGKYILIEAFSRKYRGRSIEEVQSSKLPWKWWSFHGSFHELNKLTTLTLTLTRSLSSFDGSNTIVAFMEAFRTTTEASMEVRYW